MKKQFSLIGRMLCMLITIAVLPTALPAWSGSSDKPSVRGAAKNDKSIKKDDEKNLDRQITDEGVKDRDDKGGNTVKKKVLKKAGATATIGVAGKKVKSKIND